MHNVQPIQRRHSICSSYVQVDRRLQAALSQLRSFRRIKRRLPWRLNKDNYVLLATSLVAPLPIPVADFIGGMDLVPHETGVGERANPGRARNHLADPARDIARHVDLAALRSGGDGQLQLRSPGEARDGRQRHPGRGLVVNMWGTGVLRCRVGSMMRPCQDGASRPGIDVADRVGAQGQQRAQRLRPRCTGGRVARQLLTWREQSGALAGCARGGGGDRVSWYWLAVSVVALVAAVVLWKRLDEAEERGYRLGVVSNGTYVSSHERASARHWTAWYLAGLSWPLALWRCRWRWHSSRAARLSLVSTPRPSCSTVAALAQLQA